MKCTLTGELTIAAAADARALLLEALLGGGDLELDTIRVTDVDAAGLQVILAAFKSAIVAKTAVRFPSEARGAAVAAGLEALGLAGKDWSNFSNA